MTKYAVIQLGGKQFKISEGDEITLERQAKLNIDVLVYSDGKTIQIGEPFVKGVLVKASIIANERDKKIIVARFKSKSRYRKRKGHRQPISRVKIEKLDKETTKETVDKSKTTIKKTTKKKVTKKGNKQNS